MPTVPTYQRQTQDRMAPGNTNSLRLPQNNAMTALADVGAHALDVYQQKKNQQDLAQGQEALLALNQYADDLYSHPQTGLLTKQGKNAIGQAQASIDLLQSKAEELYSALPDGPLKEKFFVQFQEVGQSNGRRFRGYEIGQTQHYEQEAYRSGNNMTVEQSRELGLAGDGGHTFAAQLQSRFDAIDTYASVYGKSDDWRQHEKITLQQNAARSAIFHWAKIDPQGFMASNGEPADAGGVTRVAKTPLRGIRNNNPGNIEASQNNAWEGQTGSDGRFVTFATPEHGLRALGKTLLSYQRQHGLDTLNEVVSRYAPSSDGNDTDAYIRALCAELGTDGNTPLDMEDPHTLSALCAAIIRHENGGKQPYSDAQLNSGISAALGISRLEAGKHAGRNLVYASANEDDQLKARQIASQLLESRRAEFRGELEERVKDAHAAYMQGKESPDPPTSADFVSAYGIKNGIKAYEQFSEMQQLGADIAVVQKLSPEQQQSLLSLKSPKPGPGFDAAVKRQNVLAKAIMSVNQARQNDPMDYAIITGETSPVDFGDLSALRQTISQRASAATRLSQHYRTPMTVFSRQEAFQLGDILNNAPSSQSIVYLDALRQGLGSGREYYAAMAQISSHAPSAAVAGAIMGKRGNVVGNSGWFSDIMVNPSEAAKTIIEGSQARKGGKSDINGVVNQTKGIPLPSDKDLREGFNEIAGEAFAGDVDGYAQAYEVAKDYYAGVMARKGDFSAGYEKSLWKQAINVATGGVYDYEGQGDVLLPWGMSESQFNKAVASALQQHVLAEGIKAPPGQYGLQSHGDSQYLVKLGGGYLMGKDGRPVVLHIDAEKLRFGEEGNPQ